MKNSRPLPLGSSLVDFTGPATTPHAVTPISQERRTGFLLILSNTFVVRAQPVTTTTLPLMIGPCMEFVWISMCSPHVLHRFASGPEGRLGTKHSHGPPVSRLRSGGGGGSGIPSSSSDTAPRKALTIGGTVRPFTWCPLLISFGFAAEAPLAEASAAQRRTRSTCTRCIPPLGLATEATKGVVCCTRGTWIAHTPGRTDATSRMLFGSSSAKQTCAAVRARCVSREGRGHVGEAGAQHAAAAVQWAEGDALAAEHARRSPRASWAR